MANPIDLDITSNPSPGESEVSKSYTFSKVKQAMYKWRKKIKTRVIHVWNVALQRISRRTFDWFRKLRFLRRHSFKPECFERRRRRTGIHSTSDTSTGSLEVLWMLMYIPPGQRLCRLPRKLVAC